MTKKLDIDKHVGPHFVLFFVLCVLVGLVLFLGSHALIFIGSVAFFTFPWWFTYSWNKYISNEDEYYD